MSHPTMTRHGLTHGVILKVTTSVPSVVERLIFFNKLGSLGGTDTIGIPQP